MSLDSPHLAPPPTPLTTYQSRVGATVCLNRIKTNVTSVTVYASRSVPCTVIAPIYESLSASFSRPKKITFAKVDVELQQGIASTYGVTT